MHKQIDMEMIIEGKWSKSKGDFLDTQITVSHNGHIYLVRLHYEGWSWELDFGVKSKHGCHDVDYEFIEIEDALAGIYEQSAINIARKQALRCVEQFFRENPDYVPRKSRGNFQYKLQKPVMPCGYYQREVEIKDITFLDRGRIRISMEDGRVLESLLTLFPTIQSLSDEERKEWKRVGKSGFKFKASNEVYNIEEFLGHL